MSFGSQIIWKIQNGFHTMKSLIRSRPAPSNMESQSDLLKEYVQALSRLPQLLRRLAFRTRTLEEELQEAMLRGNLRKSLGQIDLLFLGLGIVIGTGAFQLTGIVIANFAGSATMLCYLITGISIMCTACCYAELCVEYPVAGSAFTYAMVTFGELPAFITLAVLLLEYVLGMAAVARGFSRYLALLFGQPATLFTLHDNSDEYYPIDLMAFAVVLILSAALSFGVKESSFFLGLANIIKLCLIFSIIVAAFAKANPADFTSDFILPDVGLDGVFQGAAAVLFTYSAFDAICNAVEEAQQITYIPPALMGTVGISGFVYMLMAVSLALMVTQTDLDACVDDYGHPIEPQPTECVYPNRVASEAGYTYAFYLAGIPGMQYVISLAALFGITTSLLVGLFSVARLVMVAAREWLLPPFLAKISPRTQSPIIAQMTLGAVISVIAMLVTFKSLSQLVSFGTLVSMWVVSNALLYRRYYPDVKLKFTRYGTVEAATSRDFSRAEGILNRIGMQFQTKTRKILVLFHLIAINACCIVLPIYYELTFDSAVDTIKYHKHPTSFIFVALWGGLTLSMSILCPIAYEPEIWAIKWYLLPWLPSLAILLILFSAGSFTEFAYEAMGVYLAIILIVYVLISMPFSYIRHFKLGNENKDLLNVIEMVYKNGRWQSLSELTTQGNSDITSQTMSIQSALHPYSTGWSGDWVKTNLSNSSGGNDDLSEPGSIHLIPTSTDSIHSGRTTAPHQSSVWIPPTRMFSGSNRGMRYNNNALPVLAEEDHAHTATQSAISVDAVPAHVNGK